MAEKGLQFNAIKPGPSGKHESIGFEAMDSPGHYIRYYAQQAYIDSFSTPRSPSTWAADATFEYDYGDLVSGYYSLMSSKIEYFYHVIGTGAFRFDPGSGSQVFLDEASFRMVEGVTSRYRV